jgi:hypothetical protein
MSGRTERAPGMTELDASNRFPRVVHSRSADAVRGVFRNAIGPIFREEPLHERGAQVPRAAGHENEWLLCRHADTLLGKCADPRQACPCGKRWTWRFVPGGIGGIGFVGGGSGDGSGSGLG